MRGRIPWERRLMVSEEDTVGFCTADNALFFDLSAGYMWEFIL